MSAKFVCSACGADRGCNCNAPAVEKLAEKKEQDRRRAKAYRGRKDEQKQRPRHVTTDEEARVEQARAEAAAQKARERAAKAEAERARHERKRAEAEARRARDEFKKSARENAWSFFADCEPEQKTEIHSSSRTLLVKALGMLGSEHDGEVLAAARKAEQERRKLGMTWDQLIVEAENKTRRAA